MPSCWRPFFGGFCVQIQQDGDDSMDVEDNNDADDSLSDSSGDLTSLFESTSYLQTPSKPDAAATSSSSSDVHQLANIRHMAAMFARGMMLADSAAEATQFECPSLQSRQWSSELAAATLTGMRVVAELMAVDIFLADDEDTETNIRTVARLRRHVQHILSLPSQP